MYQGKVVWDCILDIYGDVLELRGERNFISFRFQGQYEDQETGLYYNRFRYYSPETGNYISQDPIGLAGNNPTLYGYVRDCNQEVDLYGLFTFVTKEGFLFRGIKIKMPFDLPVQRFGQVPMGEIRPWGLRVGTNKFVNRTFVAIKPEWNPLTLYNTGVIPKGTTVTFGIIGPQGLKYHGGLLQFNVNNNDIKDVKTKEIVRCK